MDYRRWTHRLTLWDPRIGRRRVGRQTIRWADFFKKKAGAHWTSRARDRQLWRNLEATVLIKPFAVSVTLSINCDSAHWQKRFVYVLAPLKCGGGRRQYGSQKLEKKKKKTIEILYLDKTENDVNRNPDRRNKSGEGKPSLEEVTGAREDAVRGSVPQATREGRPRSSSGCIARRSGFGATNEVSASEDLVTQSGGSSWCLRGSETSTVRRIVAGSNDEVDACDEHLLREYNIPTELRQELYRTPSQFFPLYPHNSSGTYEVLKKSDHSHGPDWSRCKALGVVSLIQETVVSSNQSTSSIKSRQVGKPDSETYLKIQKTDSLRRTVQRETLQILYDEYKECRDNENVVGYLRVIAHNTTGNLF
ncbi:hypothetical protein ANN_22057 [Periplaneta americana]|uniref:Uncharacterized protein n=1 Tax=Periplaneta americana TaxID=6978 RepID=A0ABQ8S731_PERAM|nr:hypothetical protein ANN_22057 [Periplaneta americana]